MAHPTVLDETPSKTADPAPAFPHSLPTEDELIRRKRWSRDDWVDFSLRALERGGVAAVRIEDMARRSGRTPGSFYHYFSNREQLHAAMVDVWYQRRLAQIDWFHDHLRREGRYTLSGILQDFVERRVGGWGIRTTAADLELAMRIWARTHLPARRALQQIDTLRVEHARAMVRAEHDLDDSVAAEIGVLLNWVLAGRHIVFLPVSPDAPQGPADTAARLLTHLSRLAEASRPAQRRRPKGAPSG